MVTPFKRGEQYGIFKAVDAGAPTGPIMRIFMKNGGSHDAGCRGDGRMNVKRLRLKKHSIFITWIVSYLVVILVCLLVSSVVYIQADRLVETEMNTAKSALLRQTKQSIDSRLEDIAALARQIASGNTLQGMLYLKDPLANSDYYMESRLLNEFHSLYAANSFISKFYVYISGTDSVPASDAVYSRGDLFDYVYGDTAMTYQEWLDQMDAQHHGEFVPVYRKDRKGAPVLLAYMNSLLYNDKNARVTLVILFSESKLANILNSTNIGGQEKVLILDSQNELIAGDPRSGQELDYRLLPDSSGLFYRSVGGQEMAVGYQSSEVNDWKYVSVVPVALYKEKVVYMRRLTYFSMGFCLLLGGAIAYLFAKRHYNPVREIMSYAASVRKRENREMPRDGDEFRLIREFIRSTQSEKEQYFRGWEKHNASLKADFLWRLLKGDTDRRLEVKDVLEAHGIVFESEWFGVLLFGIEDYSRLFEETGREALEVVKFSISNVVEEYANREGRAYAVDLGDMVGCLVNFPAEVGRDGARWLAAIASESKDFFEEKLEISVTVSFSRIHQSLDAIPDAYREAAKAMDYRIVLGSGTVVDYDSILPSTDRYPYSFEKERSLINCIQTGEYENALRELDDIFNYKFNNRHMSIETARCLMFGLINTMMQALDEIGSAGGETFLQSHNPVDRMLGCRTLDDMRAEMAKVLKEICDYKTCALKKGRNAQLMSEIMDYVQKNYADGNLNIAGIADRFGMNPIYLSRVFKDQTGEPLLEYIQKIRMDKAKTLLEQGRSVVDTAELVGYNSTKTFVRAFKKQMGITPGTYSANFDKLAGSS